MLGGGVKGARVCGAGVVFVVLLGDGVGVGLAAPVWRPARCGGHRAAIIGVAGRRRDEGVLARSGTRAVKDAAVSALPVRTSRRDVLFQWRFRWREGVVAAIVAIVTCWRGWNGEEPFKDWRESRIGSGVVGRAIAKIHRDDVRMGGRGVGCV